MKLAERLSVLAACAALGLVLAACRAAPAASAPPDTADNAASSSESAAPGPPPDPMAGIPASHNGDASPQGPVK